MAYSSHNLRGRVGNPVSAAASLPVSFKQVGFCEVDWMEV